MFSESMTLPNGARIPMIGLGVWLVPNDKAAENVRQAISAGYRHVDTAQAYGNEEGTGEGIRTCGVPRDQIFVTSKVRAEHKTYQAAKSSIDESLRKLQMDYVDLMLIHSPQPWSEWRGPKRYFDENKEVWKALVEAHKAGKAKAIGVSNFLQDDLESLLGDCEVRPMANQILVHIGNTPLSLIDYCQKQNIPVESYSPLGHGVMVNKEQLAQVAQKYKATIAQLCVRYVLQLDTIALPKALSPAHVKENAEVGGFTIDDEDMKLLKSVELDNYGEFANWPVFSMK